MKLLPNCFPVYLWLGAYHLVRFTEIPSVPSMATEVKYHFYYELEFLLKCFRRMNSRDLTRKFFDYAWASLVRTAGFEKHFGSNWVGLLLKITLVIFVPLQENCRIKQTFGNTIFSEKKSQSAEENLKKTL